MQPKADDKVGWATLGQQPYNIDNNNQPFSSLQHRCRPSQSPSHADLGDNWYFQHQPFESSTFSSFVAGRISICFREYLYVRFSCGSFQLICTNCTRCSSPHRWYYLNASNKSASEAPVVNRLGLMRLKASSRCSSKVKSQKS